MKQQNEQQKNGKLKALVRDLERELSQGKAQVEALEETHQRLRQAELICQELADENRRLRHEISDWQESLAKAQEDQKELTRVQQQVEALKAEHAQVIECNRELREKLAGVTESGKISSMLQSDTRATIPENRVNIASELTGSNGAEDDPVLAADAIAKTRVNKERTPGQTIWGSIKENWQLSAIFGGVVAVMLLGAVTAKFLKSEAPSSSSPAVFASQGAAVEEPVRPVSKQSSMAAPRIQGRFQTVRPTQVFSEPNQDSALIAKIDKGTKLNVVDSRNGWLEVRSKHGRPPGFVRQEATVRIASN